MKWGVTSICKVLETAGHVKNYGRHMTMQMICRIYWTDTLNSLFLYLFCPRKSADVFRQKMRLVMMQVRSLKRIRRAMGAKLKRQGSCNIVFHGEWFTPHIFAGSDRYTMRGDRYCIPVKGANTVARSRNDS